MIRTKIHLKHDDEENSIGDVFRFINITGEYDDIIADIRAIAYGIKKKLNSISKNKEQKANRIIAVQNAFSEGLRMSEEELAEAEEMYFEGIVSKCLDEDWNEEMEKMRS